MAEIRRVGADDWELLKATRLAALSDAPYAFGSTYAREAKFDETEWRNRAGNVAWFVVVDDGQAVGLVAGANFSPHPARDLLAMWTHETARGSGLADALVAAVVQWARAEGASELLLEVADGNDRARAFYERMDFVSTGKRQPLPSNPTIGEEQFRLIL